MPDLMRDPVCGMAIALGDAFASAETEGRRFHFCCFRCHAAFLDTPHRFVAWAGDPSFALQPTVMTRTAPSLRPCHFAS